MIGGQSKPWALSYRAGGGTRPPHRPASLLRCRPRCALALTAVKAGRGDGSSAAVMAVVLLTEEKLCLPYIGEC